MKDILINYEGSGIGSTHEIRRQPSRTLTEIMGEAIVTSDASADYREPINGLHRTEDTSQIREYSKGFGY